MTYTSVPRNGTNRMKINHSALPPPPMSWLRKMSPMILNRKMNHTTTRRR
jgi:hypothetical protein